MVVDDGNLEKCTMLLTGYLRAHSLSVNQLVTRAAIYLPLVTFLLQVHVSGAGDYQLTKIEILKDPFPLNPRKEQDLMDADEVHDVEVNIYFGY